MGELTHGQAQQIWQALTAALGTIDAALDDGKISGTEYFTMSALGLNFMLQTASILYGAGPKGRKELLAYVRSSELRPAGPTLPLPPIGG